MLGPIRNVFHRRIARTIFSLLAFMCVCAHAQVPSDPSVLWEQATIYRDEWGVPHVQADNFLAMSFAFGYAQAEDHIEGMLRAYRVANGRAAEVYGEEYALSDEFSLKMGYADLALAVYPYADAITRDLCNGFALGVNAWIIEHPGQTPEWAEGVRPEDILALMHCYLMSFAPFDLPGSFARPAASNTGNAWAIAPSRTTNGDTILVMNPHTDYRGPFQWYEAQLTCGGFNIYGATLFGLPVIVQGHNGLLGWSLTPNMSDFADVYMEPRGGGAAARNPADPTGPQGGALVSPDTLRYLQTVMNAKRYFVRTPAGMEERQVPYLDTPYGPVVGRYNNRTCSYFIGGFRDFGAIRQLHLMASATDYQQFRAALNEQQLPTFHIVYADHAGNLLYLYNSKVGAKNTPPPARDQILANRQQNTNAPLNIISWDAPVPANDTRFAWGPIVRIDQLPLIENPKSGYVQACGNPPWTATDGSGVDPNQYPPWLVHDPDTFRARRVRRLLSMGARSYQDAQAMVYDVLVPGAMFAMPKLLDAADKKADLLASAHPDLAPCLDILRNWNYVAEPSSEGMTVFHVWWNALCTLAGGANEFAVWEAIDGNSDQIQALALQAADEAARMMRSEFETLNKPWGDAHVFKRGERTLPAPGSVSGQPLFVASDALFEDGTWNVTYGYGFAMAVSFGARTEAATMVPFGASEDPVSPHYDDQMKLIQDRRLKPTRFEPEEVRRLASSAYGSVVRVSPPGMESEFTIRAQGPVTVTTKIDTRPITEIPEGLATFTVYAQIDQQPEDVDSEIEMKIYVPEEVCAQSNLGQLAIYGYDNAQGWAPLQAQELIADARVIAARDRRPRTYAVLGPAVSRIKVNPFARQLVALAVPDAKPLIAKAETELPPPQSAAAPPPSPRDMIAAPIVSSPAPVSPPAQTTPAEAAPVTPTPSESAPTDPNAQQREEPAQTPAPAPLVDSNPPMNTESEAQAEPAVGSKRTMPVMQYGLPTAPVAQKGAKEGALAWGQKLQLRPPGIEGLVLVSAKKQVGARLVVLPEPDQPLPAGLAAYTKFVRVDVQADGTPVELTVHLRPAAESVAASGLAALKLYAFDPAGGWEKLSDQSCDDAKRDFKGKDASARTYAVLGPAELVQKQASAR
ncbi:MAG: penicillin acylase family protein [Candidatus Hydrogenedentes bacterium]|nr:penicillin acylase family protein [Candidatus Hydrogenedentota bacterium]